MAWAIITIYTCKCAQMDPQQLPKTSKFYSRCKKCDIEKTHPLGSQKVNTYYSDKRRLNIHVYFRIGIAFIIITYKRVNILRIIIISYKYNMHNFQLQIIIFCMIKRMIITFITKKNNIKLLYNHKESFAYTIIMIINFTVH